MRKKPLFSGLRSRPVWDTLHVVPIYSTVNGGAMFELTLYGLDDRDVLNEMVTYIHGPMRRRGYSSDDYVIGIARRVR